MSDLRERLIEAGAHGLDPQPWQRVGHEEAHRHDEVATAVVNAAWPIIEAELQKRDRDHFDALVATESECLEETERLAGKLTEANKLLEQTIEVLERFKEQYPSRAYRFDVQQWWTEQAKPLLDNLKALKKEGTE